MGITGLIPFLEKASRRANVSEFSGCTVAIDTYCWLHKGAFACADKLVRGEETDIYIKYCLKYVTMLLSRNIKPILVFDGQHLPAKAMTESKRRETRDISKKRAAELLSLGKIDEARSFMRRSVDITHSMALELIKECRKRNVDCIVAPYEADAQLAYLNINNIAQLVITEDSDLILFGCTKVLFKMDLDGAGTLVETIKIPLVMKCPIEHYTFDKFRQMCIMSGCDYLASLPGIGLAKARQFVTATQDPNFANALRKLPSFFNRANLIVTDEYRENFLKAEATFKHQYVYDPIDRQMVRLTEPDDEDIEEALCVNAGKILDPRTAFQLALGNLDPFTLKKMDNWDPGTNVVDGHVKSSGWKEQNISKHPTIWNKEYKIHLTEETPWTKKAKKQELIIKAPNTRVVKRTVTLPSKYVPETEEHSLTIESLSKMYCIEPVSKKQKTECDQYSENEHNIAVVDISNTEIQRKSPILENKERSFKKCIRNGSYSVLKKLSRFPRTILDENVVESKFFKTEKCITEEMLKERISEKLSADTGCFTDSELSNSQKENSPCTSPVKCQKSPMKCQTSPMKCQASILKCPDSGVKCQTSAMICQASAVKCQDSGVICQTSPIKCQTSPILEPSPKGRNPFKKKSESMDAGYSEVSIIENTCDNLQIDLTTDTQTTIEESPPKPSQIFDRFKHKSNISTNSKKSTCRVAGLRRTATVPSNQPTLLSKFGFQKKPVLKR